MKVLRFIGIDQNILDYCSSDERWLYKVFNILQLALIVIVGFSTYYLFQIIFEITWLSVTLAFFWSFVFYNLYRFILMTTSGQKGDTLSENIGIILPNVFKIGVIAFFGVFISLPIELFLNKDYIETNLPKVLNDKIILVKTEIDSIYATQYQEIDSKIVAMQNELYELDTLSQQQELKMQESIIPVEQRQIFIYLNKLQAERILKEQKYTPVISTLKVELAAIEGEKTEDLDQYIRIISGSNLLLDRFELLFNTRLISGFILAAMVVILFLLPLLYKLYSLYSLGFQYEKVIEDRNRHEILYHYHLFKERYKKITNAIFGEALEFIERYEDAPFNTLKKHETVVKQEKGSFSNDLVKEYYSKHK